MPVWRLTSPRICHQQAGDPEEPMFHFESEGRKKPLSQFKGNQAGGVTSSQEGQPFCSIQVFSWLDEAHPC